MMKKLFAVFAVLAMFLSVLAGQEPVFSQNSPKPAKSSRNYKEGRILVKMKSGARISRQSNEILDKVMPVEGADAEPVGDTFLDGTYVVEIDSNLSVEDAIQLAQADPRVEYAEPDYILRTADTPNDEFFNQQWGLLNTGLGGGKAGADIGASAAWDVTTGSEDVIVAVIDTGTDLSHPDLQANAWINTRETPGNGIDDDGNGFVDDINGWNFHGNNNNTGPAGDFHATHLAGIIGAVGHNELGVTGVAWRVKLMALKFISGEEGSTSDAIKAINYVIAMRKRGENVKIINASWGGPGNSKSLRKAIVKAGKEGILFVNAAGNGGDDFLGDDLDRTPDYPSAWSVDVNSIISVAALDRRDNLPQFSNFGNRTVNIGAPGVDVLSTLPGGGYGFLDGTSMATPHVAGVAALILTLAPALTPAQIKQRIISTAEPVLALGAHSTTAGRLNAFNAVTDTVPPVAAPGINRIATNAKVLTIEGIGFRSGSTQIDVNGAILNKVKFSADHQLLNGSFTQMTVKLGKTSMTGLFPAGIQVVVTVTDTLSGNSFFMPYTRN
jgi:subtilisin family serine protease